MPGGDMTFELLFQYDGALDLAAPETPALIAFMSYAVGSTDGGNSILFYANTDQELRLRFNNTDYFITTFLPRPSSTAARTGFP